MRISDWSSDVCSSDLRWRYRLHWCRDHAWKPELATVAATRIGASNDGARLVVVDLAGGRLSKLADDAKPQVDAARSEEHTSELQSLMRISYAVFCLKKKKKKI